MGATACNASAPAAVAPPWNDNSREGNTPQSQSEGAVRGDRHCPLRKQVLYNLLKTKGFYKADHYFNVLGGVAPATVASPFMISAKIRGNSLQSVASKLPVTHIRARLSPEPFSTNVNNPSEGGLLIPENAGKMTGFENHFRSFMPCQAGNKEVRSSVYQSKIFRIYSSAATASSLFWSHAPLVTQFRKRSPAFSSIVSPAPATIAR